MGSAPARSSAFGHGGLTISESLSEPPLVSSEDMTGGPLVHGWASQCIGLFPNIVNMWSVLNQFAREVG